MNRRVSLFQLITMMVLYALLIVATIDQRMDMWMAKTAVHQNLLDKPYGQIWQEHLGRMLSAGYTESQARASHVMWRSIGKKLKAGRY